MSSSVPVELNFLTPFLARAHEMAQSQPVMAYYCKYYAVSLALKGPNSTKFKRSPQTDAFLANLFDSLEEEKNVLSNNPAIRDLSQGAIYVRELAYRVFLSAERLESSPETIKKAPQSYLAALNFLQVYRGVFLEDDLLDPAEREQEIAQVEEKSKYAKWRIIEIKKDSSGLSRTSNLTTVVSPAISTSASSSPNPVVVNPYPNPNPTVYPSVYSPPVSASHVSSPPPQISDPKIVSDCEKHARYAISALHFDDFESAAENLKMALKIIQPLLTKKGE